MHKRSLLSNEEGHTDWVGFGHCLLRVSLGLILLSHGLLKVFIVTIPGTVTFFATLGLPAVAAYLTIFGELAGGIALILGGYTRAAATLSIPILLGATWAHIGNGWLFTNAGGGWEFPLLLVAIAISVACQGPGRFAIDNLSNKPLKVALKNGPAKLKQTKTRRKKAA